MIWMHRYKLKRTILIFLSCILTVVLFSGIPSTVLAQEEDLTIESASAILLEASTGTIIYEKNADEIRSPASITKIMTLLLTFEALQKGNISLQDDVVTSAYAKSMGGSQVFLEEGEVQSVDTLIKCIAVASGNDASVALAEFIEGSEAAFVDKMNEKAALLGMKNTHFVDCCGLSNENEHHTTARDVAIMSRELINRYPEVFQYSKIWMEDIVHETRQGTKNFTLASTNKLLKQYPWTTGLKTGSTSKAKYCLSATACKNDMSLIAVIMGAPDYKIRFAEAKDLLEYGYRVTHLYKDMNQEQPQDCIKVQGGKKETICAYAKGPFQYILFSEEQVNQIEKRIEWVDNLKAPIEQGEQIGKYIYELQGEQIGEVPLLATETIEKATFLDYFAKVMRGLLIE